MFSSYLQKSINILEQKSLKRDLRLIQGPQGSSVILDGKEVLNFCSNNYLGLADDPRLAKAAIESMEKHGFGSGASRLVCGNMAAHEQLEAQIARFKGVERCLVFSTGYMANIGIIASLFTRDDIIFCDRLNHASIIDGIQLSQAKMKRYPHRDMQALEEILKSHNGFKKRCIITDSVFSMDGDIAPLDKIVELAKKYDCMVMIDEAHAVGVMGKNGRGLAEHFAVEEQIDIQMGTFSKAVGSFGAYCCGSNELISFLINKARSFIYTTAMPPSVAAVSSQAIAIIESEPQLREKLWENVCYVKGHLKLLRFDLMDSKTPIIPILVKETNLAVEFSNRLLSHGILMSAIRPPTVPHHTARLRLTVMATHTKEEIDYTLNALEKFGKELKIV